MELSDWGLPRGLFVEIEITGAYVLPYIPRYLGLPIVLGY